LTPSSSPPVIPISWKSISYGNFGSVIRITYHLEPLLHGSSTLQVLGGGLNVEVDGLLREVDHVRGEERLAVRLEVALVLVKHSIQPRQELLGAVVGVQNDWNAI
jgi:hypothetical protein